MRNDRRIPGWVALAAVMVLLATGGVAWAQIWPTPDVTLPAEDVRNTKHNFFTNQDVAYDTSNTTEICVFCHTPHGGRTDVVGGGAPLWNRALPTSTYTMYNSPNFDSANSRIGAPIAPQGVSLACLSCHDGTVAIDALINAPGSGGFLGANKVPGTSVSLQFKGGVADLGIDADGSMNDGLRPDCTPGTNCFHSPLGPQTAAEFFVNDTAGGAATFGMAPFPNLTTDLSDDHPISMQIPDGTQSTTVDPQFADIAQYFGNPVYQPQAGGVTYLTRTGVLNDDPRDRLRAYPAPGTTDTEYVECASCHNPHTPRPLFLRLPSLRVVDPGTGAVSGVALTSGGNELWSTHFPAEAIAADGFVSNNPNFQSAICTSCHEK